MSRTGLSPERRITKVATPKPKRLITHNEDFHTDDVFATALLLALFPDAEVVRSRDEAVIASGDIVYDVGKVYDPGKGRYDHHQAQAGKRKNGIVYSSFGLLWREYGLQYCDNNVELRDAIDTKLVVPIDANDNGQKIYSPEFKGVEPYTIDDVIYSLNPKQWAADTGDYVEQFQTAVTFAGQILYRTKLTVQNELRSREYLLGLYESAKDRRVLVTDKIADVSSVLIDCQELLYVVSPRSTGNWGILAVSKEPGSFTPRRPFPEAWRAQPPEILVKVTGVADVTFCHANGFFAVADSKQGAKALAHKALQ